MMKMAWECGLDGSKIPDMTPAECRGMFEQARRKNVDKAADSDSMAWLIGTYIVSAFHSPKNYPKKPRDADRIRNQNKPKEIMSEDEMKNVFRNLARKGG